MSKRIFIHAAAAIGPHGDVERHERHELQGDPAALELKTRVKEIVGVPLRQASHLVELAAIGSQLCLKRLPVAAPADTAVYVGTGLAEVRKNEAVFHQVMSPGPGMASPFDFINAANNMAAFYAAKLGNFNARNLTVSQEEFSFEWALQLARDDLRAGEYRQALVGGVDENSQPRANHLRRISLPADMPMGEGSGWLYLSVAAENACGELLEIQHVHTENSALAPCSVALAQWQGEQEICTLLPGLRISADEAQALSRALPALQIQNYLSWCGGFHTAAACGMAALFDAPRTPGLFLHLNRDRSGHIILCVLRVLPT